MSRPKLPVGLFQRERALLLWRILGSQLVLPSSFFLSLFWWFYCVCFLEESCVAQASLMLEMLLKKALSQRGGTRH